MTTVSSIEWTEQTWNPTVGCTKISPGCKHCYAEGMARRLKAMGTPGYENGFSLTLLPTRLEDPLKRKRPTTYFVNSMSDLFHDRIPDAYIEQVSAGSVMDTNPYGKSQNCRFRHFHPCFCTDSLNWHPHFCSIDRPD